MNGLTYLLDILFVRRALTPLEFLVVDMLWLIAFACVILAAPNAFRRLRSWLTDADLEQDDDLDCVEVDRGVIR